MLDPQQKELLQFFTPVVPAFVAMTGIGVAIWLSILHAGFRTVNGKFRRASAKFRKRSSNSLYDRRFAVYEDSGEYLARIMRTNGDLESSDLQWYVPVLEKGNLLFGADVGAYLKELQDKAADIYVKSKEAKHKDVMKPFSGTDDHLAVAEMMKDFCGPMLDRRRALFWPYLKLEG